MRLLAWLSCATLAACGANVVFEEPGAGGAGTGGSTSIVGGRDPGGGSTADGPIETPADCFGACAHYEERGCSQPGCLDRCTEQFARAGDCMSLLVELTSCIAARGADSATCGVPPDCAKLQVQYLDCIGAPSGSLPSDCTPVVEGALPGGPCSSYADCGGQVFSETCFGQVGKEGGRLVCECTVDGFLVGTCTESDEGCDAASRCCEFVLPWSGTGD